MSMTLRQFDDYRMQAAYFKALESGDEKAITKQRFFMLMRN